jgi:hypothetical protein
MKNTIKIAGIIAIAIIGFTVLSGCASTDSEGASRKQAYTGFISDISIPAKNFDVVNLVFVEAVIENGNGESLTYNALLRAAQEIGGNGIVNVMIDVKRETQTTTTTSLLGGSSNTKHIETWYGSALAIRYTNTLPPDTPLSTTGRTLAGGSSGSSAESEDNGGFLGGLFGGIFSK